MPLKEVVDDVSSNVLKGASPDGCPLCMLKEGGVHFGGLVELVTGISELLGQVLDGGVFISDNFDQPLVWPRCPRP